MYSQSEQCLEKGKLPVHYTPAIGATVVITGGNVAMAMLNQCRQKYLIKNNKQTYRQTVKGIIK